jgi:outer membrane cobalamin receptor
MRVRFFTLAVLFLFSYSVKAQQDSTRNALNLSELSLEELMNINVVTASGFAQTASQAPSTIQVITAQQITERGYEQLEDVLKDIPGIDMIHINGYAPTLIYFRGMYGAENLRALLMIDGIVENNIIGSNDMAGPAYSLHNVQRIEIIWGPASALYGANAYGGIINIITKKGSDINGLHAEKSFGSFNTSAERISLGLNRSNLELSLSGSLYSTDGPRFTNRDPEYSGSYVDRAYSFNGALSYYTQKSQTTLGFRTYRTPMGWGTYSNSPNVYLGLPNQGNSNVGVIGIVSRDIRGERSGLDDAFLRTVFLQTEFKPGPKFNILGRIVYRETGTAEDSYVYVTADGRKLIRANIATYSNRASGDILFNYAPGEMHRISGGIQFFQDNVEQGARKTTFDPKVYLIDGKDTVINVHSTFLPRTYDIRNNFGSYLQYVLNTGLLGSTSFTAGLRYDYNSYFKDAFSPRLVIVNSPSDKFTFKLQFGKAFRAPTQLEIYQTGRNFQITTEKIRTYEANLIYSISKNLRLQINGFRNELRDVIILSNLAGLTPNKNPGMINTDGIESSLNLGLTQYFDAFMNFTYQNARGENLVTHVKRAVPGIAKFKGNAGLGLHASDLFTINLTGNWVGRREAQSTNPYGPVAGYFLVNSTISTGQLFNQKVSASIIIHNLFNKRWLDPGFRTADGTLYSTVLEQPGINGLFKISVDF